VNRDPTAEGPLPRGYRLTADPGTRRLGDGRVVLGGRPVRLLRLSPAGAGRLEAWLSGEPVGPGRPEQRLARRLLEAGIVHPRPDPIGPGLAGRVTLVVPTHDRPDRLERMLADVVPAVGAVIIVDDGSPDPAGIAEVATRRGARVLRAERPSGPAAARNRGWEAARTELVLFVDTDCSRPRPGPRGVWLERLGAHLADPEVGVVAPRVVPAAGTGPSDAALVDYESTRSPLDQGRAPARVHPRGRVRYVPAAALLVRRAALEALGGFDESMPVGEDVDLVWRAANAGITVRYDPSVTVAHEVRADLRSWLRQRYRYGTSAAALERRHPGTVAPVSIPWPTALSWALTVLGHPRAGVGLAVANGTRIRRLFRSLDLEPRSSFALAAGLATRGHLGGGRLLADALRRVWWPLLLIGARSRVGRRLAGAALIPVLWEALTRPGRIGAGRWLALRLADDAAYGAGVWVGALKVRRAGALLPRLSG